MSRDSQQWLKRQRHSSVLKPYTLPGTMSRIIRLALYRGSWAISSQYASQFVCENFQTNGKPIRQILSVLAGLQRLQSAHLAVRLPDGRETDPPAAPEAGFYVHLVKPLDIEAIGRLLAESPNRPS